MIGRRARAATGETCPHSSAIFGKQHFIAARCGGPRSGGEERKNGGEVGRRWWEARERRKGEGWREEKLGRT